MLDLVDYKKEPIKDDRFNWHRDRQVIPKIKFKTCAELIDKEIIIPIKLHTNNH